MALRSFAAIRAQAAARKGGEAALAAEGVIDGAPDSQRSRKAIQAAFSEWAAESGAPFAHISRVLAMSVD